MKYKCKEDFVVFKYDEDGRDTGDTMVIEAGSLWEVDPKANILGGEVHIKNSEKQEWLELSKAALEERFEIVN